MTDFDAADFLRGFSDAMENIEEITEETAENLARGIARIQRRTAPRRTGIGSRSVSVSQGQDAEGRYWEFGPSERGFPLAFEEYGTEHQPARPFIRPAIEAGIATEWPAS